MQRVSLADPSFTYDPSDPRPSAPACGASARRSAPGRPAPPSTSWSRARLCPYHYEYGEEEWLLVVEGRPTVRTPEGTERSARRTSSSSRRARGRAPGPQRQRRDRPRADVVDGRDARPAPPTPTAARSAVDRHRRRRRDGPPLERRRLLRRRGGLSRRARARTPPTRTPTPDADFAAGGLQHLAVGNDGRLLDARRTPVRITAIDVDARHGRARGAVRSRTPARAVADPLRGARALSVRAPRGARTPTSSSVRRARCAACAHPITIEPSPSSAPRPAPASPRTRATLMARLDELDAPADPRPAHRGAHRRPGAARRSRPPCWPSTRVDDLDDAFAGAYVSNPWAGERVKGHAIVLAELGLARYRGPIVRDPAIFDGAGSSAARAEHLIVRARARPGRSGADRRPDGRPLSRRSVRGGRAAARARPAGVDDFARAVADAHVAGGPATRAPTSCAAPSRSRRCSMTFWETPGAEPRLPRGPRPSWSAPDPPACRPCRRRPSPAACCRTPGTRPPRDRIGLPGVDCIHSWSQALQVIDHRTRSSLIAPG